MLNGRQKYYHVFFNDNKSKEIKRNYLEKEDKVSKINIVIDSQIDIIGGLFHNCPCIESIYFKNFLEQILRILEQCLVYVQNLKK